MACILFPDTSLEEQVTSHSSFVEKMVYHCLIQTVQWNKLLTRYNSGVDVFCGTVWRNQKSPNTSSRLERYLWGLLLQEKAFWGARSDSCPPNTPLHLKWFQSGSRDHNSRIFNSWRCIYIWWLNLFPKLYHIHVYRRYHYLIAWIFLSISDRLTFYCPEWLIFFFLLLLLLPVLDIHQQHITHYLPTQSLTITTNSKSFITPTASLYSVHYSNNTTVNTISQQYSNTKTLLSPLNIDTIILQYC